MNSSERQQRIFKEALGLGSPEERRGYVSGACGEDQELRQAVEALLAGYFSNQSFIPTLYVPASPPRGESGLREGPGMVLGRYKLLQKIGEGGCGVVYMAEQAEPVRRRVALKIIKLGMDTKSVIARFEAERQALALMEHANIAKVLDAGATESGRPYFVMELVRGIRITDYCDQNRLAPTERLELFVQVCHAIQHAHQKGIIHRDIKPSNILVSLHDGVPIPVVIDFGIAKATERPLTDKTMFTGFEQFIGTPAYMSPEQAELSRLDIDTRSDIYALGVLLYELLTGKTPFDSMELLGAGVEGMRRTIREKEPVRPSTRLGRLAGEELTTTANRRRTEGPKLVNLVRGDLDWIVMKCLEKDRTRRYETANALAQEIARYQKHEMVVARPPTTVYKVQKFMRRNKVMVSAAGLVAAALVLGILVSTWQAVRATQERRRASAEAIHAQQAEKKAAAAEQQAIEGREYQRSLAYAADMNLAQQALSQNNLGRAESLLNRHRPKPGEGDLRGWEWRHLWRQCRSDELTTLYQDTDTPISLSTTSNGNWLAVGGYSRGRLSVWDLATYQQLVRLSVGDTCVRAAFSPREPLLAFGVATNGSATNRQFSIGFWDGNNRQVITNLPLSGECVGLAFSEDGQRLVTASAGDPGEITLWSVPGRKKLASHSVAALRTGLPSWPLGVSRDGRLAAYCSLDTLSVLDLATGKLCWTNKTLGNSVACVFSPDGKVLATSSYLRENIIRLWDVASGRQLRPLEGHRSYVLDLVFWPDGKTLASASGDQTILVWDLTSGQSIATLRGHRDEVWRLALLPDKTTLLSGSKDGTVRLWDTTKIGRNRLYTRLPSRLSTWCFDADSRSVVTVDQEGRVARWRGVDFQEMQPLFQTRPSFLIFPFRPERFSADGRFLAVSLTNGVVQVWDISQSVLVHELSVHTAAVMPVCFLSQGKKLIVMQPNENSLQEWDLSRRQKTQSWSGVSRLSAVAFSPDEGRCLMAGYRGDSLLRNMTTGREDHPKLSIGTTESVTFSPDGKLIAAADWLSVARLWEAATLQEVATLRRFLLGAHSATFSPDGTRLAASSGGKETLKLWSVESQQELLTLESQESRFVQSAFSPDGNVLGALSMEGFLHLWHAPTWSEIEAAEKERGSYEARP